MTVVAAVGRAPMKPLGNKRPSPELDAALGRVIREHRLGLGLDQSTLAQRVGVAYQQVAKYERGGNQVSVARLIALADALGVEPTKLLDEALARIGRSATVPSDALHVELETGTRRIGPAGRKALLAVAREMAGATDGA